MINIPNMESCNFHNKNVLLRVDFNVPIRNESISDATRILRTTPTIQYLMSSGARVIVISHFGRPITKDSKYSLKMIVKTLSKFLNKEVKFIDDCIGKGVQRAINTMDGGDVILLENLRFYKEEEQNDLSFAKKLASLADVYINDAFSCSHRAHASISRVTEFLPSYAGFCFQDELRHLQQVMSFGAKPITVIVGGAKIETKIKMLIGLVEKVDYLILGGAIANNFLIFNNVNIGKSLFQSGIDSFLHDIVRTANKNNCKIIIPEDVLVAMNSNYETGILRQTESILNDDTILDIGPKTSNIIKNILKNSRTLIWNGPIGFFERSIFATGTVEVMRMVSDLTHKGKLTSIIGGGDSLSAIKVAGLTHKDFSYISTGGSAFLSYLGSKDTAFR